MGTRFECVLHGLSDQDLLAAGEEALECIAEVERWISRFRKDSPIARINAAAGHRPVRINAEVFDLLQRCEELRELTGGAFDVRMGHRMEALGFWGPAAQAVVPSSSLIILDERAGTCALVSVGQQIDLGAIGKGFALDCAAEVLEQAEIPAALIHGGTSTSIAIGSPDGDAGWPLAVSHPDQAPASDTEPWIRLHLSNQALSVSAPHGRTVPSDGAGPSQPHVLDPRTADPIPLGGLALALHASAAEADAWSTALLVLQSVPAEAPLHSLLLDRQGRLRRHPIHQLPDVLRVREFGS